MKQNKIRLAVTAAVAALLLSISASAVQFQDAQGHWAETTIENWADAGLLSGYPDGTFRADNTVTRAEFSAMLNSMLKLQGQGNATFTDVARNAWYYDAVTALAEGGIIEGTRFRPGEAITREEAAVMFAKAMGLAGASGEGSFTDRAEISAAALPYINSMVAAGYIGGYPNGSFGPNRSLTRAEAVQIFENAAQEVRAMLAKPVQPIDLTEYLLAHTTAESRALPIDCTETNEHPLTGYFTYTFSGGEADGRSFKLYMGEHAALRAYITVIAIPDGVEDTYTFLQEQGWLELANRYGELLFVLEPGIGGWGTPEKEEAYLAACIGETVGNTAFDTRARNGGGVVQSGRITLPDGSNCPVFTGHSCNYYVAYEGGCAVLESWTSYHPTYVIAQALINGETVGSAYLNSSAARTYNGINTGSYYPGFDNEAFSATLKAMARDGAIANTNFITNRDIPVPTLLVGYGSSDASVSYWKEVNDVVSAQTAQGVYRQSLSSDAWQTAYANRLAESWGATYGISQVQVRSGNPGAGEIRDFLATYTRYTNPFAYSNNLAYRMDYYEATQTARTSAESGKAITTYSLNGYNGNAIPLEVRALESARVSAPGSNVGGTVYSTIFAFADYDDNGILDPREALIYVPDIAANSRGDGAPAVVVFPGMTQAASTFMDCSAWWAIANEEGCVVIIVGEYCATGAVSLIYGSEEDNANLSRSVLTILDHEIQKAAGISVDFTRVYASGHSLGSRTIQTLTHNTESYYFAAVASTSFPNTQFTADGMPSYLLIGQSDICEPDGAGDMVADPWMVGDVNVVTQWIQKAQTMNGLKVTFTPNNRESFLAACSSYDETGRYYTYTWANEDDVPLVQFTRSLAREHNCYPEEFRLCWDFLENYRLGEDGVRYYSASAFEFNDAIVIQFD